MSIDQEYKDFSKWCRDNPAYDLDPRLHTHSGRINDGGYILHKRTGTAFKAWQASRQALASCSEIPNHSVTGNAVAMGDLTDNDDEEHERSILIQFGSLEDFYAARASGQCRFTVFGGGV